MLFFVIRYTYTHSMLYQYASFRWHTNMPLLLHRPKHPFGMTSICSFSMTDQYTILPWYTNISLWHDRRIWSFGMPGNMPMWHDIWIYPFTMTSWPTHSNLSPPPVANSEWSLTRNKWNPLSSLKVRSIENSNLQSFHYSVNIEESTILSILLKYLSCSTPSLLDAKCDISDIIYIDFSISVDLQDIFYQPSVNKQVHFR